jgi:hypothetical protein
MVYSPNVASRTQQAVQQVKALDWYRFLRFCGVHAVSY